MKKTSKQNLLKGYISRAENIFMSNVKTKNSYRSVCFSFFLILFAACSSSMPSEADATRSLEQLSQKHGNLFKVKSVRKTDGQASELNKVQMYKLVYQAEVECLRSNAETSPMEIIAQGSPPVRCSQIGESKRVQGAANFQKTEQGWQEIQMPFAIQVQEVQ
jgi:hypothetical protein